MDNNGQRTRAVITGMGVLSCLGHSVGEYWDGLTSGTSGIAELTLTDTEGYPCKIGGEVRDFNPTDYVDRKESRRLARFSQLAIGATTEAIADAGLDISAEDPDRVAVLLGCGAGGLPETDQQSRILSRRHGMRMSPFFIPMMLVNMAAANVSRIFGATGYTNTCVTACAAGTQAIGEAAEVIRRGAADVVITGRRRGGHLRTRAGRVLHDPRSYYPQRRPGTRQQAVRQRAGRICACGGRRNIHPGKRGTRTRTRCIVRGVRRRVGSVLRRLPPGATPRRRPGRGVGDTAGPRGRRAWSSGHRLRKRARDVYAVERRLRDAGNQARVRRTRGECAHQFDEIDDWPLVGRPPERWRRSRASRPSRTA